MSTIRQFFRTAQKPTGNAGEGQKHPRTTVTKTPDALAALRTETPTLKQHVLPPDQHNAILTAVTQCGEPRSTNHVASFNNQPGSTPGQHGVPFVGNTRNQGSSTLAPGA